VTVDVSTVDRTATTGTDYTELLSQMATFLPGETVSTVAVTVLGDTTVERDEELGLLLTNSVNADIGDDFALGTIINDDSGSTGFGVGNILLQVNPVPRGDTVIYEFTPTGTLVQQITARAADSSLRDIALDANGNLSLVNNSFSTLTLTVYDSVTGQFSDVNGPPGWTGSNSEGGGLEAFGNFLFASDFSVLGTPNGVIRFDVVNGTSVRFGSGGSGGRGDSIDLDIGNDGLLYVMAPSGSPSGGLVTVYDPVTLQQVRQLTLGSNLRHLTVDSNGEIYASETAGQGDILHFAADGTFIERFSPTIGNPGIFDLDLSQDDRRIIISEGAFELGVFDLQNQSTITFNYPSPAAGARGPTPAMATWVEFSHTLGSPVVLPLPPAPTVIFGSNTLIGGAGNDTLVSGDSDDLLDGQAGNDSLDGGGGMDTLLGGGGNDTIVGGSGDDEIDGGQGDNILGGGNGSDVLILEPFADGTNTSIDTGGADAVEIRGTAGADTFTISQVGGLLRVSTPNASITVSESVHTVTIAAMGGDDTVTMGNINDTRPLALQVQLGDGADTFDGQSSFSNRLPIQVLGQGGDDTISDTADGDILDGNDVISGDRGDDSIRGGAGNDTVFGDLGDDQLLGGDGADSLFGGSGQDLLRGGNDDDRLNGNAGHDTLEGELGNDSLLGGAGHDLGRGGTGADSLRGQGGHDTLFGGGGNDTVRGDAGNDVINGGDGDDTISGGYGRDLVTGGEGSDQINGNSGNDTLLGDDGDDSIIGGGGADILLGGDGDDRLSGSGSNADTVAGNEGDDNLTNNQAGEIDETFVLADEILALLVDTQL
jgi:Ca2+-binding RTX toxin-like protein